MRPPDSTPPASLSFQDEDLTVSLGRRRRRWQGGILLTVAGLVALSTLALLRSTSWGASLGARSEGAQLERLRRSPHFAGTRFVNDTPALTQNRGQPQDALFDLLRGGALRRPDQPLPLMARAEIIQRLATPPASGLRITWIGHSTAFIEIDGQRFLTDPMFSERASPSTLFGARRFQPPALALTDLPPLDGVILSHDHYDHLDLASIRALSRRGERFYAPLGVGAHLERWGVPRDRIIEHDVWERSLVGGITLVATPARHFSGRSLFDRNHTLWTSWALIGPAHRVFFSGDTGLIPTLARIGAELGPFDVALLEIGAWNESWADIHLGPHGAARAAELLRVHRILPIHWATFELSTHAWFEPVETLVRDGSELNSPREILTPILGTPVEPTDAAPTPRWWREFMPQTKS